MRAVDLSIVIVNWHSAAYVDACVRALATAAGALECEIIVVDNASYDSCEALLVTSHPEVRFIQNGRNLGFGAANNVGAAVARGTTLLFLNPDTVPLPGSIARLYRHLLRVPDAGVMGGRLLNSDGTLQTSCVQPLPTVLNQFFDTDLLRALVPRLPLWRTGALLASPSTPVPVEAVSGACMMIRRVVFEAVGGFSPAFFMYGEDLDLCARVAASGYRTHYAGDCMIVHHGGGSSRHAPSTFAIVMMCESVSLLLHRLRGPATSGTYRAAMVLASAARLCLLVATAPAWIATTGLRRWRSACRKWAIVLAWALRLAPQAGTRPAVGVERGV